MSFINNSEVSNVRDALDWLFNKIRTLMAKDIKINHANFPDDETVEDALDLLFMSKVNTSTFDETVSLLNEDITTLNSNLTQTNVELESKVNIGDVTGDVAYKTVQIGSGITGTIAGGYWTVCGKTIGFNIKIVISSGKISVNPNSPTHILKEFPPPLGSFGFPWAGSLGDGTVKMGGCSMTSDGSISAYAQAGQGDVYVLNASGIYLSK